VLLAWVVVAVFLIIGVVLVVAASLGTGATAFAALLFVEVVGALVVVTVRAPNVDMVVNTVVAFGGGGGAPMDVGIPTIAVVIVMCTMVLASPVVLVSRKVEVKLVLVGDELRGSSASDVVAVVAAA